MRCAMVWALELEWGVAWMRLFPSNSRLYWMCRDAGGALRSISTYRVGFLPKLAKAPQRRDAEIAELSAEKAQLALASLRLTLRSLRLSGNFS